jgi:RNA polymerase sigma-70 factor (ECF subfamily)
VGEPPSDEELMDQVRQGSAEAFTTLFHRHRAPLYGFVLRMTRDPESAADVFQDTFLKVHRARDTWSGQDASFRSWLFRIATNAVRDRHRQVERRRETFSEEDIVVPSHEFPAERLMLERALAQLAEPLREAFLLGVVHGLDHNELAAVLAISPDNARARVSRARSRLRELLEGN